ncbi:MAG: hypothetical protein ACREFJ_05000 [Acetobacteraceae bacterium]
MPTDTDFHIRLRITASALGCTSRKDLCARFHTANPRTQCDLDRLNKWTQGRALPRSAEVYEDWAKVLGTKRSGAWLASCGIDSFRAEVAAVAGITIADLYAREALHARQVAAPARPGIVGGNASLIGAFACYSLAWSPHYHGKLIRGSLSLAPGTGGVLQATYSESLMGRLVTMPGEVAIVRRTMHLAVRDPESELPIFFSLILPGAPISVLCGVMSGTALLAPDSLPSAGRVVMIRLPGQVANEAANGYLEADPVILAADLETLGISHLGPRLAARIIEFLGRRLEQVTSADRARIAELLDPGYLRLEVDASA